ncbi:hypothetical protein [Oerskovia enterophila]|uniref:Uncharacterized protein n=1 Tax=Oerskovia enterophila TaxID=43678 RepID=A0A163SYA2_9CELL|nr:hypothetical protein [Oerskovia enterophila]KZM36884.1 hypothetical protein OJAG_04120 [Oerskovia enterophila]
MRQADQRRHPEERDDGPLGYGDRFSAGSFTDGRWLVEVTKRGDQSTDGTRLTAHDLRTGEEA